MNQPRPVIVHITASPCFGGPERQMIELGNELSAHYCSVYVTFGEEGRCKGFVEYCHAAGIEICELKNDTPRLIAAYREIKSLLESLDVQIIFTHGYKANMIGLMLAKNLKIPIVSVSRGWTAESWKVRLYERLDRLALRRMDRVVCVSQGQAEKVRSVGILPDKITVIHNAIRTDRFDADPAAEYRQQLGRLFGTRPPRLIIGAAGRLSPEKGFNVLIEAAALFAQSGNADFGFVLFGDGPLRESLQRQIDAAGLSTRFILAGFTSDLDQFMPHFDLFVQSSHTEGLPNVLLEAAAAGVAVVATDVGGTREVVVDGETGLIVPPDDPQALATGIERLSTNASIRDAMGRNASRHVGQHFTFAAQAEAYKQLFHSLLPTQARVA